MNTKAESLILDPVGLRPDDTGYYKVCQGRPSCCVCSSSEIEQPNWLVVTTEYDDVIFSFSPDSGTPSSRWWITDHLGFACSQACLDIYKDFPIDY